MLNLLSAVLFLVAGIMSLFMIKHQEKRWVGISQTVLNFLLSIALFLTYLGQI